MTPDPDPDPTRTARRRPTLIFPTDLRRPCDRGLLCDGKLVAARLLRRARPLVPGIGRAAFRGLSRRPAAGREAELKALFDRLLEAACRTAGECRLAL